jgi:hypothetical protein
VWTSEHVWTFWRKDKKRLEVRIVQGSGSEILFLAAQHDLTSAVAAHWTFKLATLRESREIEHDADGYIFNIILTAYCEDCLY